MPPRRLVALALLAAGAAPVMAQTDPLARAVRAARHEVAVVAAPLAGEPFRAIDADAPFSALSLAKLATALEVGRRLEEGTLGWGDSVFVRAWFVSPADSAPFAMQAGADPDPALFQREGGTATVHELLVSTLAASGNLSANLLLDLVMPEAVRATLATAGVTGVETAVHMGDLASVRAGRRNVTTAHGALALLRLLVADSTVLREAATRDSMVAILARQRFRDGIPRALPRGSAVSNKTGLSGSTVHDAALVRVPGAAPFLLVILTRGARSRERAEATIRRVTQAVVRQVASSDASRRGARPRSRSRSTR